MAPDEKRKPVGRVILETSTITIIDRREFPTTLAQAAATARSRAGAGTGAAQESDDNSVQKANNSTRHKKSAPVRRTAPDAPDRGIGIPAGAERFPTVEVQGIRFRTGTAKFQALRCYLDGLRPAEAKGLIRDWERSHHQTAQATEERVGKWFAEFQRRGLAATRRS